MGFVCISLTPLVGHVSEEQSFNMGTSTTFKNRTLAFTYVQSKPQDVQLEQRFPGNCTPSPINSVITPPLPALDVIHLHRTGRRLDHGGT